MKQNSIDKQNITASVILPVYNQERFLSAAIESIINQKLPNEYVIEIIIIDDGSTDSSAQIIKNYQKSDSRIIFISHDKNLGIATALNKGISLAQGKYIIRMDADDISLSDRFIKQINFMEKNPEIGICGSAIIVINEHDEELGINTYPADHQSIRHAIILDAAFSHPSVIIRKSVLQKEGLLYDESFLRAQDFELFNRMVEATTSYNLSEPLIKYRTYTGKETSDLTLHFSNLMRKRNFQKLNLSEVEIDQNMDAIYCLNYRRGRINQQQFENLVSLCCKLYKNYCHNHNKKSDALLAQFLHSRICKIVYRSLIIDSNTLRKKIKNLQLVNKRFPTNPKLISMITQFPKLLLKRSSK